MSDNAFQNVIAELRRFAAWKPASDAELAQWYEDAQVMHEHMQSLRSLGIEVDEIYWHYMSDADIRARDVRYGQIQQEGFVALIDELERRFTL